MKKSYQNKLSCTKIITKLSKKRRAYAMLAIRTICGENESIKTVNIKSL